MNKHLLEQYDDMKREYKDTERRIRQTTEELRKCEKKYEVQDSVTGGTGGTQSFTIKGYTHLEYKRKKTLLMSRKLRLEKLAEELEIKLDEVERYIDTIEDSRKRLILKYRYVDGLPWRDIAKRLGPGNNEDSIRIEIGRFIRKSARGV